MVISVSHLKLKPMAGSVLLVALLGLGALALTPQLTGRDLAADQAAVRLRTPAATRVFLDLTAAAQEAVGLAALAVGIVVLLLRHRRWDAARLFVMAGARGRWPWRSNTCSTGPARRRSCGYWLPTPLAASPAVMTPPQPCSSSLSR